MKKILYKLTFGVSLLCVAQASAQDTQIKFFGQPEFIYKQQSSQGNWTPNPAGPTATNPTGYIFDDKKYDTTKTTNFNTGKFVMFVTSQLNERISVLSENSAYITGSASTGDEKFNFEIERLLLRYYLKDYFSVRVGKMFNPLGYWNNQYNLGLVLQPTIQRPLIIRNSSEGGALQIKDVGAQFEGDNMTKLRFNYRLFLSNGIGYNGSNNKNNNNVAVTASVGIEPLDGLKIIASGRTSSIRKGVPTFNGITPNSGSQLVTNASIAYMNPEKKPEFIAEYYQSNTKYDDNNVGITPTPGSYANNSGIKRSFGYFAYAGYKVTSKAVPYFMYSYSQAGQGTSADIYYSGTPGVLANVKEFIFGFRYKISSNLVWKIEYVNYTETQKFMNGEFQLMPAVPGVYSLYSGDKTGKVISNTVRMQFAFAF